MKKSLFLIILTIVPSAIHGQSYDLKAMKFYYSGLGCYASKNYFRAMVEFTKAIEIDSGFLQAWENRGVSKFRLNDFHGAISDYDKALDINPDDYNTFGRKAWAEFGLEDLEGAIEDFSKAIEGNINDADFRIGRGEAKYKLRDFDGALSDFDRVVRFGYASKEQRGRAFFWRGFTKIDIGQRTDGCLDLERSKKLGYEKAFGIYDIYCH
jgi:tetratricopeptide (TPR) repeat protein